MAKENKNIINLFSDLILETAKKFKIATYNVTPAQFWTTSGNRINEWDLRKLGGFTNLRETLFPTPDIPELNQDVIPRSRIKKIDPNKQIYIENFTCHEVDLNQCFRLAKIKKDETFKVIVLPDMHIPEHDPQAVSVVLKFLKDYKPHGIIILGDFLEMRGVTHHDVNDLKPKRLVPEIQQGINILKEIEINAGPQCVFKRFIEGNHESWLSSYLIARSTEIADGLESLGISIKIQDLLKLKDFGYRLIPLNEILRIGNSHFIHGYYTSQHHAAQHLRVFGVNIYYGHTHNMQTFSSVSVKGLHEAMSMGCLRNLYAPFMKGRPNSWVHSIGIFEYMKDGSYTRYNPVIIDGQFSYNGKIYKGLK